MGSHNIVHRSAGMRERPRGNHRGGSSSTGVTSSSRDRRSLFLFSPFQFISKEGDLGSWRVVNRVILGVGIERDKRL